MKRSRVDGLGHIKYFIWFILGIIFILASVTLLKKYDNWFFLLPAIFGFICFHKGFPDYGVGA